MKYPIIILLSLISISFLNCDSTDSSTSTWFDYQETQCADAWQTGIGSPSADVENAVINYLDGLGVNVQDVTIDNSGLPEVCLACSCLSGRVISVKADAGDETVLVGEGFVL